MKNTLLILFLFFSFLGLSQQIVDSKKNAGKVKVYINYNTNSIVALTDFNEIKDFNIDVFNITGNFVKRYKIQGAIKGEYYIPNYLKTGMYIFKITYDKMVFTKRVVIK